MANKLGIAPDTIATRKARRQRATLLMRKCFCGNVVRSGSNFCGRHQPSTVCEATIEERLEACEARLGALEAKTHGRAPEATGDLSSEAFVRGLRDAWE